VSIRAYYVGCFNTTFQKQASQTNALVRVDRSPGTSSFIRW